MRGGPRDHHGAHGSQPPPGQDGLLQRPASLGSCRGQLIQKRDWGVSARGGGRGGGPQSGLGPGAADFTAAPRSWGALPGRSPLGRHCGGGLAGPRLSEARAQPRFPALSRSGAPALSVPVRGTSRCPWRCRAGRLPGALLSVASRKLRTTELCSGEPDLVLPASERGCGWPRACRMRRQRPPRKMIPGPAGGNARPWASEEEAGEGLRPLCVGERSPERPLRCHVGPASQGPAALGRGRGGGGGRGGLERPQSHPPTSGEYRPRPPGRGGGGGAGRSLLSRWVVGEGGIALSLDPGEALPPPPAVQGCA